MYTDRWFKQRMLAAAGIGDSSKKAYADRLKAVQAARPGPLLDLLRDPAGTVAALASADKADSTVFGYITALMAFVKHAGPLPLAVLPQAARDLWAAAFEAQQKLVDQRYLDNQPSARQQDAYVTWAHVLQRRDQLGREAGGRQTHMAFLLLCMHTMIRPLRADFGQLRVFRGRAPTPEEARAFPNFVRLDRGDAQRSGEGTGRLTLGEFKTAKHKGPLEVELPRELLDVLEASLRTWPREFVLVSCATQRPWALAQSYINWANRTLLRVFGKNVSISLLRHIYINSLDMNALSTRQKEEIASEMGHSVRQQDRYRLLF